MKTRILAGLVTVAIGANMTAGPADAYDIDKDTGELSIQLNLKFPPNAERVQQLEDAFEKAQILLCDATDERVKLNEVVVTIGGQHEKASDFWWYDRGVDGRSHAGGNRVVMFGNAFTGDVVAHELGHLVLNLLDSYDEQRRYGGACGIGRAVDLRTPTSNTLMQQGDSWQCRDSAGMTPGDYDRRLGGRSCKTGADCVPSVGPCDLALNQCSRDTARACGSDTDCEGAGPCNTALRVCTGDPTVRCGENPDCDPLKSATWGDFDTCAYPELMSELTLAASNDLVRGGGVCAALPGTTLDVSTSVGWLHFNAANLTTLCTEDGGTPVDRRAADTCADGSVPGRVDGLDLSTFARARDTAHFSRGGAFEVFDEFGHVTGRHEGESNHRIRLFARVYDKTAATLTITLGIVGDADDYNGGVEGGVVELGRFFLVFDDNTRQLISVNGIAVDATGAIPNSTTYPEISLGGGMPRIFGIPTTDATGAVSWGQMDPTAAFQARTNGDVASPVLLSLHFGGMEMGLLPSAVGGWVYDPQFWGGAGHSQVRNGAWPQRPLCENAGRCSHSWNSATHRFEATDGTVRDLNACRADAVARGEDPNAACNGAPGSDRDPARSDWQFFEENATKIGLNTFTARPFVDPETPTVADCGGSAAEPVHFEYLDPMDFSQMVLVLDRSGSMKAKPGDSNHDTRMQFVQAATRQVIRVFADENVSASSSADAVWMGLVSFDDEAKNEATMLPVGAVDSTGAPRIGFWNSPDMLVNIVDGIEPNGWTAMGLGLRSAAGMMAFNDRPGRTIVLLSDGANNRPEDGSAEPDDVAKELIAQGFQIIYIPTGESADRTFGATVEDLGGTMLDAASAYEVIPAFFEMYAELRGETLAVMPLAVEVEGKAITPVMLERFWYDRAYDWAAGIVDPVAHAGLPESVTVPIFVEHGADKLNVMLSVREMDSGDWEPEFTLRNPDGDIVAYEGCANCTGRVLEDRFFRIIRVESPPDGPWTLEISANDGDGIQRSYVAAHIANDGPDCLVSAELSVSGDYVEVDVAAAYDGMISSGVTYEGVLRRPDGFSIIPLEFETEFGEISGATARVALADMHFRGVYTAEVFCLASEDAKEHPGEGTLQDLASTLGTNDASELTGQDAPYRAVPSLWQRLHLC